jgi:hypothetical protein
VEALRQIVNSSEPKRKKRVRARSAISNATKLLNGLDGRSSQGRRYRDLCEDLREHLGGNPSVAQDIILRRCATLASWAELQEAAHLAGASDLDINAFATVCNSLRRLILDLGLEPTQLDVTPSLARYLDERPEPAAAELACAKTSEHASDEGGGGPGVRESAGDEHELARSSPKISEKISGKNPADDGANHGRDDLPHPGSKGCRP